MQILLINLKPSFRGQGMTRIAGSPAVRSPVDVVKLSGIQQFSGAAGQLMLLGCQIGVSEPCFVGGEEGSVVDPSVFRE